jgi:hypothetical protein
MRIGILGSGLMGAKLGTIFARAGHEVVFSYSRSQEKLERLAREAKAKAGSVKDAAQCDVVLLAVHWSRVDEVLKETGPLAGKIVISCSLPMSEDDSGLVLGHTTSGAETLQKKLPKAKVVSAFQTVPSEVFFGVFEKRKSKQRPNLVVSSDDKKAKEVVSELVRDVGFEPVDAGPLKIARYSEPFALLIAQLAYEGEGGPELAYSFDHIK